MNIEERIFTDKELSYEQIKQMRDHARKYDYVVDKKDFLKNITPYEQKLVLLETRNPYEVLSYLDELSFDNSRLILSQLDSLEITTIINEMSSEDKKKFYATFSDLGLVNKFIVYDKNSKEYIAELNTDRKVEILNSTKEDTKEAATKVYGTITDEEKQVVAASVTTVEATSVIDETSLESINDVMENQVEIQQEESELVQEEVLEETEEIMEEIEQEEIQQEEQEETLEETEEIQQEEPLEEKIEEIDMLDQSNKDKKNKENLELFHQAKTTCEEEIITKVVNSIEQEEILQPVNSVEPEVIEETNEKTL